MGKPDEHIGMRVNALRLKKYDRGSKKPWTLQRLAEEVTRELAKNGSRMKVKYQNIQQVEKGVVPRYLNELAKALGSTPEYLQHGVNDSGLKPDHTSSTTTNGEMSEMIPEILRVLLQLQPDALKRIQNIVDYELANSNASRPIHG